MEAAISSQIRSKQQGGSPFPAAAVHLLEDAEVQEAVARRWARLNRNGVVEGIAFKQLYKDLCVQLACDLPLARAEEIAHEKWIVSSINGAMDVKGFKACVYELLQPLTLNKQNKAAVIAVLNLSSDPYQPILGHTTPRTSEVGETNRHTTDHREIRVQSGKSLAGVVQDNTADSPTMLIQSFTQSLRSHHQLQRLDDAPTNRPHIARANGTSSAANEQAVIAGRALDFGPMHSIADNFPHTLSSSSKLLKSPSLRNVASSPSIADTPLVKLRRAVSKKSFRDESLNISLHRSHTDPALTGLHPIRSNKLHRRAATHSWDTLIQKKQAFRCADGGAASPMVRMNSGEPPTAGNSDLPFAEWAALAISAPFQQSNSHQWHSSGSPTRQRQAQKVAEGPLPCCICRKEASFWCDNCVAAFCRVCWCGIPDHDTSEQNKHRRSHRYTLTPEQSEDLLQLQATIMPPAGNYAVWALNSLQRMIMHFFNVVGYWLKLAWEQPTGTQDPINKHPREQPRFNPKQTYGASGASVLAAPSKYIQSPGLIRELGAFVRPLHAHLGLRPLRAGVLTVPFLKDEYGDDIEQSFRETGVTTQFVAFNGECSWQEIERLCIVLRGERIDFLVSVGGGKCLDTGKVIAHTLNIPGIVMPTLASNDAPCSALSVIYTPDGEFEEMFYFPSNPDMVLVDTAIIANAPKRFLIAGMGDAMATFYEADACRRNAEARGEAGGRPTTTAVALSKLCRDLLLEHGRQAATDIETHAVTLAVSKVVEANILLSGLGFESGGLACAHALHNGLTTHEGTHNMLHGEKVAFSTVVQLCLEGQYQEAELVTRFFQDLGLPTTLTEIGINPKDTEALHLISAKACDIHDSMKNMPSMVTPNDVVEALRKAHDLGAGIKQGRDAGIPVA